MDYKEIINEERNQKRKPTNPVKHDTILESLADIQHSESLADILTYNAHRPLSSSTILHMELENISIPLRSGPKPHQLVEYCPCSGAVKLKDFEPCWCMFK